MTTTNAPFDLTGAVTSWQAALRARRAMGDGSIDELTDHLTSSIESLQSAGLSDEEAFIIAAKRVGDVDEVAADLAGVHTELLWKQLAKAPAPQTQTRRSRRLLLWMLGCAVLAGLLTRLGVPWWPSGPISDMAADDYITSRTDRALYVTVGALTMLAVFFARLRGAAWWGLHIIAPTVIAALALVRFAPRAVIPAEWATSEGITGIYSFGQTTLLTAILLPVVLWALVGLAHGGFRWNNLDARLDAIRFTGEWAIYYGLIALGGGLISGLALGLVDSVGWYPPEIVAESFFLMMAGGAVVVAAWLVEEKKSVIENIVPVLARLFTPLAAILLTAFAVFAPFAGGPRDIDRGAIWLYTGTLAIVFVFALYTISAREADAAWSWGDGFSLAMVVAGLVVDSFILYSMAARIAEFGVTANKTAVLGFNVLLFINLAWVAWQYVRVWRTSSTFRSVERWQANFLPVLFGWAAVVAFVFPFVF